MKFRSLNGPNEKWNLDILITKQGWNYGNRVARSIVCVKKITLLNDLLITLTVFVIISLLIILTFTRNRDLI